MSETVFNRIFVIIGDRGTGKTPFIVGGDWEKGMAWSYAQKGMGMLVVDTLDHPKYRHLPTIQPRDFSKLGNSSSGHRCLANPKLMNGVIGEMRNVWNTLIVFEDAYKYVGNTFSDELNVVVADSKQQNNDLVFMYACWAWVPLDLCRIADYYVIFQTSDSPDVRGKVLGGCYSRAMTAHKNVMAKKKPYLVIPSGV